MNKSNKSYKLRLRDLPEEEKPREKLRKYGPTSLKNYELMAVILGKGTRKEGILELSKRIMSQYGDQAVFSQGVASRLAFLAARGRISARRIQEYYRVCLALWNDLARQCPGNIGRVADGLGGEPGGAATAASQSAADLCAVVCQPDL